MKSKHKLTDSNSNRLAFWSRIVVFVVIDYGLQITPIALIVLSVSIAILSQKFIWILFSIYSVPITLLSFSIFPFWVAAILILFSYYKMRFDQIHSSIKSVVSNCKMKVIDKRRRKQLMNIIEEHKLVSNEIHKLNLMIRRSAGFFSFVYSADRIIILYLISIINDPFFVKLFSYGVFPYCGYLALEILGYFHVKLNQLIKVKN